jgi:hypothetical protein
LLAGLLAVVLAVVLDFGLGTSFSGRNPSNRASTSDEGTLVTVRVSRVPSRAILMKVRGSVSLRWAMAVPFVRGGGRVSAVL